MRSLPFQRTRLAYAVLAFVVLSNGAIANAQSTVATIFGATLAEPNQKTPEISTQELQQILSDRSALVFDARPPMEFATSHVPGAMNVGQKPGTPISMYISAGTVLSRSRTARTRASSRQVSRTDPTGRGSQPVGFRRVIGVRSSPDGDGSPDPATCQAACN
jgi:3-mercaptopyruvate sulfurtransferase SseA